VPRPIFGNAWSLTTFGSHGKDVVNAIRSNLPMRYADSRRLLLMVVEAGLDWIEDLVRARDKINHLQEGGVPPGDFVVWAVRRGPDQVDIHARMWSKEQPIVILMEVAWGNLYKFVEDFIGTAILQRKHEDTTFVHVPVPLGRKDRVFRMGTREEMQRAVSAPGWRKVELPEATPRRPPPQRKEPCHCGSGKQYRKCCLPADQAKARAWRR
jgi:hypothetical protein